MINGRAAEKVRDRLVELIRDYTEKAGVKRIVLGVSGGKDSSVAAALSARAVGKDHNHDKRFIYKQFLIKHQGSRIEGKD